MLQLDEMTIIEKVEKMTNPSKDEGEWIAKTDIEEEGPTLKLVEHSEVGDCNSNCKTIAKAVEAIIGDSDTDIAEELWKVIFQGEYVCIYVPGCNLHCAN